MSATDLTLSTQHLAGTRWRLDPAGSSAGFRVPNLWGLTSVEGRIHHLDGWLEVDEERRWRMELSLDAASVDTRSHRRDKHLRSPAFFAAEDHPEVRFRSGRVHERGDGRLEVEGELEAAGKRVPLPVEVTVEHSGGALVVAAAASVDQRELGMTFSPLGLVRTPTALTVHARLRRER